MDCGSGAAMTIHGLRHVHNQEKFNVYVKKRPNVKLGINISVFWVCHGGSKAKNRPEKAIFRCQIGLQTNRYERDQLSN